MTELDEKRYKIGYVNYVVWHKRTGRHIQDNEEQYIAFRDRCPIVTYAYPIQDCSAFQNFISMELYTQRWDPTNPEGFDILITPYKGYYDATVAIAEKMGARVIDIWSATTDKDKGLHGPYGHADMEFAKEPNSTIRKYIDNMDYGLCALYDDRAIIEFKNEFRFLSNFCKCNVEYNGVVYKSAEAAFQAQKCANESDRKLFENIKADEAKKLGKTVELRKDWEDVKINIMREIVFAKFSQNEELKMALINTGDRCIIEVNLWKDKFWGVSRGTGKNWLGRILMETRDKLKNDKNS